MIRKKTKKICFKMLHRKIRLFLAASYDDICKTQIYRKKSKISQMLHDISRIIIRYKYFPPTPNSYFSNLGAKFSDIQSSNPFGFDGSGHASIHGSCLSQRFWSFKSVHFGQRGSHRSSNAALSNQTRSSTGWDHRDLKPRKISNHFSHSWMFLVVPIWWIII